jgi:hypothetical protein
MRLVRVTGYKVGGWTTLGPDTMGCRQSGSTAFTREQWAVLCVIGSVHFGCAICVSLQAPFYPAEVSSVAALDSSSCCSHTMAASALDGRVYPRGLACDVHHQYSTH